MRRHERLALLALHLLYICLLSSHHGRAWAAGDEGAMLLPLVRRGPENTTHALTTTTSTTTHTTTPTLPSPKASVSPEPLGKNSTLISSNATADPHVRYQFNCHLGDFCNKVERAVVAALDEFTRAVNVKNLIIIRINYYNFCDKRCSNDTYGWGAPTSQFTLPFEDGADLNYVYPQALAKQLAPYSSTSVWAAHDVNIEINHDMYMSTVDYDKAHSSGWNGTNVPPAGKFWFQNDTSIEADQVDLRYVVLHELLHGVGFISAWGAYFYTNSSPFRTLVDGIIEPLELELVTPGPYWFVNQDGGPAYITGFQPTMIFDKFLVSTDTQLNATTHTQLSNLSLAMQNFCVQGSDAFILNFVREFLNRADQTRAARTLWMSMSKAKTLTFQFQSARVTNSSFYTNQYLNETYRSLTLMTGPGVLSSEAEQYDRTSNRPGVSISHLDDEYKDTVDFLMTHNFVTGQTLEELVEERYNAIPKVTYNVTVNGTAVEREYRSPIGPGILRILDSMGYSTLLTRTNYTTEGNVKTPKARTVCDDSNNNHAVNKPTPTSSSGAGHLRPSLLFLATLLCVLIPAALLSPQD